MATEKVKLWYMNETVRAYLFSKIPSSRQGDKTDQVWIPKSLVEHIQKWPAKQNELWPEWILTMPDWFVEKNL